MYEKIYKIAKTVVAPNLLVLVAIESKKMGKLLTSCKM